MIELLGRPNEHELEAMEICFDNNVIEALSRKKCWTITETFRNIDPEAVDLLRKLLIYDPKKRISVEEALEHSYFRKFHSEADEITCPKVISLDIDDCKKLSLKDYRDAIYNCISQNIKEQNKQVSEKASIFPTISKKSKHRQRILKKSSKGSLKNNKVKSDLFKNKPLFGTKTKSLGQNKLFAK